MISPLQVNSTSLSLAGSPSLTPPILAIGEGDDSNSFYDNQSNSEQTTRVELTFDGDSAQSTTDTTQDFTQRAKNNWYDIRQPDGVRYRWGGSIDATHLHLGSNVAHPVHTTSREEWGEVLQPDLEGNWGPYIPYNRTFTETDHLEGTTPPPPTGTLQGPQPQPGSITEVADRVGSLSPYASPEDFLDGLDNLNGTLRAGFRPTADPTAAARLGAGLALPSLDAIQGSLDVAGFAEGPVGALADLANAAISFGRGDFTSGAINLAAGIPIIGIPFNVAKGAKAVDNVVEFAGTVMTKVDDVANAGRNAIEMHHLLPQAKEFAEHWKRAGLDIEDYVIPLHKDAHRLKPEGIHTGTENWNKLWRDFFGKTPNAGREEILEQLEKMQEDFGI